MLHGLAVSSRRREVAVASRRRAEAQLDAERTSARARSEAHRLLHDHLLHALLALAQDAGRVPADLVVADCRRAVDEIDRARSGASPTPGIPGDVSPLDGPVGDAPQIRSSILVPLPGLATGVAMTVVGAPGLTHPWVGILASVVLTAAGLGFIWTSHRRALCGGEHVTIAALAVVVWLALMAVLPPHSEISQLWLAWQASALLMVSVLTLRWRPSVLVIVGWALLQAGMLLTDSRQDGWSIAGPTLLTGIGELTVARACLGLIRQVGRAREDEVERSQRASRATDEARRGIELDEHWSRSVSQTVLPTLREVAEGSLNPHDPELKRAARRWADGIRDELALGPEQQELITALAQLRGDGWLLRASLGQDDDASAVHDRPKAQLLRLATLLGGPAAPGQQVTVQAADARASAVVIDPSEAQVERWRALLQAAGDELFVDEALARLVVRQG